MHFGSLKSRRVLRITVLLYNNVDFRIGNFEANVRPSPFTRNPLTFSAGPANIRTNLIFLEARIIDLHFAADSIDLPPFNFFGGLCKTIFSAKGHFGCLSHPRLY